MINKMNREIGRSEKLRERNKEKGTKKQRKLKIIKGFINLLILLTRSNRNKYWVMERGRKKEEEEKDKRNQWREGEKK